MSVAAKTKKAGTEEEEIPLVKSLRLVDPLLQFLTQKVGKTTVPWAVFKMLLPGGPKLERHQCLLQHIPELADRGILQCCVASAVSGDGSGEKKDNDAVLPRSLTWDDTNVEIGFPAPPDHQDDDNNNNNYSVRRQTLNKTGSLSGSTKTAAKRRLAALKRSLKAEANNNKATTSTTATTTTTTTPQDNVDNGSDDSTHQHLHDNTNNSKKSQESSSLNASNATKDWDPEPPGKPAADFEEEILCSEGKVALRALKKLFHFNEEPMSILGKEEQLSKNAIPQYILPKQAAYSGSNPVQVSKYGELADDVLQKIPTNLLKAYGLLESPGTPPKQRRTRLYSHQATAINAAVRGCHTMVATSTGSGKSLCFLLPALAAAYNYSSSTTDETTRGISLIMFPTKALAQDQLSKLQALLKDDKDLQQHIIPATLDGDCTHEQRAYAAKHANVFLTNPDTLHATILPNWEKLYKRILTRLKFVVIDEAHVYEGVFGAHVALVLSRLYRLCVALSTENPATTNMNNEKTTPRFLASSATLAYPEQHMRLLCPISQEEKLVVLTASDDGSPRSAKHFFVWNPPLLTMDGTSTGFVEHSKVDYTKVAKAVAVTASKGKRRVRKSSSSNRNFAESSSVLDSPAVGGLKISSFAEPEGNHGPHSSSNLRRRHAADETALLLARAIVKNVRCIAFCKTRMVVEWVYERTLAALKSQKSTEHLADKVQPYRGGYKLSDRREIENKLFNKELLGVVATSALELGVDIGGIDLTLHTGYPMSISSLYQQAGRAGRHKRLDSPSLSIVVCFGSPSEQHLWSKPRCLLSRGITSPMSFPINAGVVQGHLLCASKEFPLTGHLPVSVLRCADCANRDGENLLPDQELFGSEETYTETITTLLGNGSLVKDSVPIATGDQVMTFKAHPFIDKPFLRVSIRSIESVNFSIVDISHPLQQGRMDGVHDDKAVLDTLPYSRVFYHAFPGAIILHRGKKYRIQSMTRPPPFDPSYSYRQNTNLAAFAKPTREKYFTRPLSTNTITIVKQLERIDINEDSALSDPLAGSKTPAKHGMVDDTESPTTVSHSATVLPDQAAGSFAGCGIVTSKRTVHGYKKLSVITRGEISRHDLSLPDMEYDTYGIWLDAEAEILGPFLGKDYGCGVHALSHALLAVAPLFIPCVRGDLECDHSSYSPTRVCLFDERAGGSGTCAELWKSLFVPEGLLEAAIELLENCQSCRHGNAENYDGGCPACLQSGQCVKFNQFLSRSAAVVIGKRMLKRLQASDLYKRNAVRAKQGQTEAHETSGQEKSKHSRSLIDQENNNITPRKKARSQALKNAMDMTSARERLFVVGRPGWPTSENNMPGGRQEKAD